MHGRAVVVAGLVWGVGGLPLRAQVMEFVDAGRGPVAVFLPTGYDDSERLPLVLGLHGYSQTAQDVEAYLNLVEQVESQRFIYALPQGFDDLVGNPFWDATDACCDFFNADPDDSGYLRGLIEVIQGQYAIDDASIHAMGYSNGGFMAFRMACDHSDLIASVVSLAGRSYLEPLDCSPAEPVHVLHLSGTADTVIAYDGGCILACYPSAPDTVLDWALFNGCDATSRPFGGPYDLDLLVPGEETTARIYDEHCVDHVIAELWTMRGTDHGPVFYDPGAGEGPADNRLAPLAVAWMLSHRKATCAADLTGDGQADSDDFFLFLDAFTSGDAGICDLDGDGDCDAADFFAYLDLFTGC